jgi:SAM-dependent MidA family methyltransferase
MQSAATGYVTGAASRTPLSRELAERIRRHGRITFADFMRECLYHSEFGYYSRADAQRYADFYTSVDVHPIFGRLLARQLAEMWRLLDSPAEFIVVEPGAGTGRLAAQILDFAARELCDFYSALRYVAVEQSAARRGLHAQALASHLAAEHATSAAELPAHIPIGCVLSNELLDALPVHRVVVERGEVRELYVDVCADALDGDAFDADAFSETAGPLSSPEMELYFREQNVTLHENEQAEVGLDACRWIQSVGDRLDHGFVVTIDYGHAATELYNERHMRGTLLAYSQHRVSENVLYAPGEQDLTAHVNFSALDLYGSRSGLTRTGQVSQMAFLVALGRANDFADLYEPGTSEVGRIRARLLLKTLIHPEGMGETFQVFIQHKGIEHERTALTGLAGL